MKIPSLTLLICLFIQPMLSAAAPIRALLIDGQNNHDWKATTPVLRKALEETGLFTVDVATSPPSGADMRNFRPKFSEYRVLVSNYNGDSWPQQTQSDFVEFVRSGGGLVIVHAADNSFPNWKEYNEMIGLGGWGDRNEKSGPYVRFVGDELVRDDSPGSGGSHGQQHSFLVKTREPRHPIMEGLPAAWMHNKDELYDRLRGPALNMTVLATAFADKSKGGSGFDEPMLMTIAYGNGRVFHTTLGHGLDALKCVGFICTLQRGTEWTATGKVTQKVPADFPTAAQVSLRQP